MFKSKLLALLTVCFVQTVFADTLLTVSENTSSISGTTGSLDFQFNPGPLVTESATVRLLNFTGGSFVGSASATSSAIGGPLPATLTISNGSAYNDYFQDFRFGNSLSFTLDFGGAAVVAPNGMSTSTSVFTFSTFSDLAGVTPVLTNDPNGVALTATVNLSGSVTPSYVSSQIQAVPEPPFPWLVSGILALFGVVVTFRRSIQPARGRLIHPETL